MTPLRELYDLYYYPNPAKEERRRQLLTEIPTDARDEDSYGRTSLHIAAEFADCEAIASLLDRGAGVNDRDEEGHTPLFRLASRRSRVAAEEEQIAAAARLLLERGANLPRSARGTTALLEAIQNRHHAMAAVLIDSGQRHDSANRYGDNALHILCRRAADTAREIVSKERFISSFNGQWVSEKRQREAREELEELQAEQMRCYATATLLLHSGQIDPDEKNSAGRRAFDLAMEGGAQWVSALLLGEDPFDELTMETGGMNLFQALRKRDWKALEALLRAGVDPDAECDDREMNDWTGKTPLVRNRGNAAPRRSRSRPTDLEGHLSIYRLDRTRMPCFRRDGALCTAYGAIRTAGMAPRCPTDGEGRTGPHAGMPARRLRTGYLGLAALTETKGRD